MRKARRAAIIAIVMVLVGGAVIYSARRPASARRHHRCRALNGSQGRAGGERPTRVDHGPERRPGARG